MRSNLKVHILDIHRFPFTDVPILNAQTTHISTVPSVLQGMCSHTTRKNSLTIVHYVISVPDLWIVTKKAHALHTQNSRMIQRIVILRRL